MAATDIINRFGGVPEMSRKLTKTLGHRVPITTVDYWLRTNRIPAARQEEVLRAARQLNIEVEPADFFNSGG